MEPADPAASTTRLGIFDIACVVVGGIIGVGIFFTPAKVAAAADEAWQVVLAWSLGGVLAGLGALVFAALSVMHPGAGGMFRYVLLGFGPRTAFVYGWSNWLVIQAGALGGIAIVLVHYLEVLLWGEPPAGQDGWLGWAARLAVAVGSILLFTGVNVLGLGFGRGVQVALTLVKLVAVFGLVVLAWWAAPDARPAPAVDEPRPLTTILAAAMLPVLFSFGGWQQGSFVAGVSRRPRLDVPVGILIGVAVVVLAYLTINLSFLDLLGIERAAGAQAIGALAAEEALAPYGHGVAAGRVFAGLVVLSSAGILNTICLASPYVLHAMARDGLFPEAVGRLHPRTGTPTLAILAQGLWAALLLVGASLWQGDALDFIVNGVVFVDWLFFALCGAALWTTRKAARTAGRDAPVGSLACGVLFAAGALAVTVGALATFPAPSLAGLGIVAMGVWAYPRLRASA